MAHTSKLKVLKINENAQAHPSCPTTKAVGQKKQAE
jgi:hypothetical protein